jgi:hypothetical protein
MSPPSPSARVAQVRERGRERVRENERKSTDEDMGCAEQLVGTIYLGRPKAGGQKVAIKKLRLSDPSSNIVQSALQNEIAMYDLLFVAMYDLLFVWLSLTD